MSARFHVALPPSPAWRSPSVSSFAQVRMRALWEKYFNEAHGVIFVVDACR